MLFQEMEERMKFLLSEKKDSVDSKDIYNSLGIPSSQYSVLKHRGTIPYKKIFLFCKNNNININWLLKDQSLSVLSNKKNNFFRVRFFQNENSLLSEMDSSEEFLSINKTLLNGEKFSKLNAILFHKNTMSPSIKEGNICLFSRVQTHFESGKVFVYASNGVIFIGRLDSYNSKTVVFSFDNPLFPSEEIPIKELSILGKVVFIIKSI